MAYSNPIILLQETSKIMLDVAVPTVNVAIQLFRLNIFKTPLFRFLLFESKMRIFLIGVLGGKDRNTLQNRLLQRLHFSFRLLYIRIPPFLLLLY